jgi:hypothetical protein
VTLPFILARDVDPALASLDARTITTPERAEEVCDAIVATGALERGAGAGARHRGRGEGGAAGGPARSGERSSSSRTCVVDAVSRSAATA